MITMTNCRYNRLEGGSSAPVEHNLVPGGKLAP